ncbi:MAG: hypothetical protein R2710_25460 [Acidimicrobiales bacterium]
MKISSETAQALGAKLSALDLSDEEGALLTVLLTEDAEVSGFGIQTQKIGGTSSNYTEVEWTYFRRDVVGLLPKAWKPEADSYLTITMENT